MSDSQVKKILIVDDDPDIVAYLEAFFKDNGFQTIFAVNGKECYDKAVNEMPDLITLDVTMPEESGVRALRDLQENEKTANIPIIMITGVTTEFKKFIHTRKQVKPPVAYFEKPIERDALLSKVKEVLGL